MQDRSEHYDRMGSSQFSNGHVYATKEESEALILLRKQAEEIARLKKENEELRLKIKHLEEKLNTPDKAVLVQNTTKNGAAKKLVNTDVVCLKQKRKSEKSTVKVNKTPKKPKIASPSPSTTPATPSTPTSHTQPTQSQEILMTDQLYACLDWRDPIDETEVNKQMSLEIPRWTVKELVGCYSIEGTEDLSDATFLKRHSKLEVDERRRKKWDIQKLRENRVIEKLRKRYMKDELDEELRAKKSQVPFKSFFPTPDPSNLIISIQDTVPVIAFGVPIPKLPPKHFELPWHKKPSLTMSPSETMSLTKTRFFLKN